MKQSFTLTLFFLLSMAQANAQATQRLLISRSQLFLDFFTGEVTSGDSATVTYNSQLLVNENKNWTLDTGVWTLKSRLTGHSYDANGNRLYFLVQLGNDVSGWTDDQRYTWTYDANNHEKTYLIEDWDGTNWVTNLSNVSEYDVNGNLLTVNGLTGRTTYSYNAEGLLETRLSENLTAGNWVNSSREDYVYVPNSTNILSVTIYAWSGSSWLESTRETRAYDANGDMIESISEGWNINAWENSGRLLNTYDADHNLVFWLSEFYAAGVWEESLRQYNTFDDQSNFLTAQMEFKIGDDWQLFLYGRNHYTDFVSTKCPAFTNFQVFPNPASSTVMLHSEGLSHVQVIDAQGHLALSQTLSGQADERLDVGQLPAGAYFIQVTGEDGSIGVKPLQVRH